MVVPVTAAAVYLIPVALVLAGAAVNRGEIAAEEPGRVVSGWYWPIWATLALLWPLWALFLALAEPLMGWRNDRRDW